MPLPSLRKAQTKEIYSSQHAGFGTSESCIKTTGNVWKSSLFQQTWMVFRIVARCCWALKRTKKKGRGSGGKKMRVKKKRIKFRKRAEWVECCQFMKQWNGMSSRDRKTASSIIWSLSGRLWKADNYTGGEAAAGHPRDEQCSLQAALAVMPDVSLCVWLSDVRQPTCSS